MLSASGHYCIFSSTVYYRHKAFQKKLKNIFTDPIMLW